MINTVKIETSVEVIINQSGQCPEMQEDNIGFYLYGFNSGGYY